LVGEQFGSVLNARLLRLGGAARSTPGSFARQKALGSG
jgi:hypothetical protein